MFDLIYPLEPAPVVPAPSVRDVPGNGASRTGEMFPVIEPSGLVVGQATRAYCHSGVKVLHPVIHLHIIDRLGRLYLQKRAMDKDIQPGKWDTAVGGHVDYGEQLLDALYRESYEELGMRQYNPIYLCSYEYESAIEREMVNVFAAVGNFNPAPDLDEVADGRYWEYGEIDDNLGKSVFTPNFEQEFGRIRSQLQSLL